MVHMPRAWPLLLPLTSHTPWLLLGPVPVMLFCNATANVLPPIDSILAHLLLSHSGNSQCDCWLDACLQQSQDEAPVPLHASHVDGAASHTLRHNARPRN